MDNRQDETNVINEFLPDEIICNLILQGKDSEHGMAEVFLKLAQTNNVMRQKLENILYKNPEFTHAILSNCSQAQLAAFFKQFPAPNKDKFNDIHPACFVLLAPQHMKDLDNASMDKIHISMQFYTKSSKPEHQALSASVNITYACAMPDNINPNHKFIREMRVIKKGTKPFINLCNATPPRIIIQIMNINSKTYEHAYMTGATLTKAHFNLIDLKGANLEGIKLHSCNIQDSQLKGVNFSKATFFHTIFKDSPLDGSSFTNTTWTGYNSISSSYAIQNYPSLPGSYFISEFLLADANHLLTLNHLHTLKEEIYDKLPSNAKKKEFRDKLTKQIIQILKDKPNLADDILCEIITTHPLFNEHRDIRKYISSDFFHGSTNAQKDIRKAFDEAMEEQIKVQVAPMAKR